MNAPREHRADGRETAWRVWSLMGDDWAMASFAYSKRDDAELHARFHRTRSIAVFEVREEVPEAGFIVVDDIDWLMSLSFDWASWRKQCPGTR